jgi:hypothetical protein
MKEYGKMNVQMDLLIILQSIIATALVIGAVTLLGWILENPMLKDDEMRKVLEQTRSIREEAIRQSRTIARQESERLYR